jgi:iron complex outermembrane receptor protein
VTSQKYYFNPSFLFNISDKTQLIVEGDYLKNYFTPDFGVGTLVLDKNTSRSVINDLIDIRKNPVLIFNIRIRRWRQAQLL